MYCLLGSYGAVTWGTEPNPEQEQVGLASLRIDKGELTFYTVGSGLKPCGVYLFVMKLPASRFGTARFGFLAAELGRNWQP